MTRLERTTHVCLIVVCVVSLGLLLERRFTPARVGTARPVVELADKRLDVPGMDWTKARLNTVLVLSTSCHFCKESTPFYRRLAEARRKQATQVAFAAVSRESAEQVKSYLAGERVVVDAAYQISGQPALNGTPTLLLIDSNGIVKRSYVGKLAPSQEEEVLNYVRHAAI